jgi:hypothetical protein
VALRPRLAPGLPFSVAAFAAILAKPTTSQPMRTIPQAYRGTVRLVIALTASDASKRHSTRVRPRFVGPYGHNDRRREDEDFAPHDRSPSFPVKRGQVQGLRRDRTPRADEATR